VLFTGSNQDARSIVLTVNGIIYWLLHDLTIMKLSIILEIMWRRESWFGGAFAAGPLILNRMGWFLYLNCVPASGFRLRNIRCRSSIYWFDQIGACGMNIGRQRYHNFRNWESSSRNVREAERLDEIWVPHPSIYPQGATPLPLCAATVLLTVSTGRCFS
jgi:hypothetical protein